MSVFGASLGMVDNGEYMYTYIISQCKQTIKLYRKPHSVKPYTWNSSLKFKHKLKWIKNFSQTLSLHFIITFQKIWNMTVKWCEQFQSFVKI